MKRKLNCILLIDDDEPTNFLNRLVIEEVDCTERIEIAQSGKEALEYLSLIDGDGNYPRPDLVFLDINMPAMDGWEFLAKYNQLPETQKAKIIVVMLTTSFNPEDEIKARNMEGVSGFCNKPLTPGMLRQILQEHFPGRF
jgi:CheY-like chemotaxis protein